MFRELKIVKKWARPRPTTPESHELRPEVVVPDGMGARDWSGRLDPTQEPEG